MIVKKTVFGREVKVFSERPATIVQMFHNTVSKYPEKEAIIKGDTRLRYREMEEKVAAISANLQTQFRVQKGDRIALILNNSIEFALLVFACAKLGAIIVPLNTRLKEKELTFMLQHSGSRLLVTEKAFKEKVDGILAESELSQLEKVFFIDGDWTDKDHGRYLPFSILEKPGRLRETPQIFEEDPLFIMYTSGTTGVPKGAIGSHIGVIHSAMNYKNVLETNAATKTLIAVPLFHVTGLIGQFLHVVLIGGTSVIMTRFQTEPFIETVSKEQITFLFNVPTIYVMMMSHALFSKYDYFFVKTIAYGGAPISNETISQLRKSFPNARLHNAYGATETSSPATIMPISYPDSKIESIGLPVPVADVKVVNDQMEECSVNEVGELLIKGPMVVEGYWDNAEANGSSFFDGYWLSGDMASIDEDGFVYIMDRKKDMINRGGEKIFSIEVENALYNHPAVLEAAVVGVPDDMYGQQVKAFIVRREGASVNDKDVKTFLADQLADYKIPKEVEFVSELPRNPGGKVLKGRLSKIVNNANDS